MIFLMGPVLCFYDGGDGVLGAGEAVGVCVACEDGTFAKREVWIGEEKIGRGGEGKGRDLPPELPVLELPALELPTSPMRRPY